MNPKRRTLLLCQAVVVAAMVSACTHSSPIAVSSDAKSTIINAKDKTRVPDEYLIKLSPDTNSGIITDYFGKYGIKDIFALGGETYLLVLQNDPGPEMVVSLVFEDDRVLAVQPNIISWDYRSGSNTKNRHN
jgi:ABC-type Fe3+-hydroxamate transport system substrate-binding protein